MASDMFSAEEAFNFVREKLAVADAPERISSDRRSLLDDIVTAMQTSLLFQNIRLLQKSPEHRRRPTLEEIKEDILSGYGGLCYNLNVATYYILKALGFDAVLVRATCTSTVMFLNNHIICHVRNVEKPGDTFLVEAGFGFPTYRAISLDFEKESPEFRDSFIQYKYLRHDGKILRMHKHGDLAPRGDNLPDGVLFVENGWRRFYFSETTGTTSIEEFSEYFDAVFTQPEASPFHSSFRIIGFPNKKAVMVINEKTLIENESGDLVPEPITGGDDGIVAAVKHHFPVLPENLVRDAICNWRQSAQS